MNRCPEDLAAYLRARLDEDEAAARLSWPGPWSYNPAKRWLEPDQLARERAGLPVLGGEEFVARRLPGEPVECIALTGPADDPSSMGTAAHIARWDPDRVLADIEMKRAVLDLVVSEAHPEAGAPPAPDAACLADRHPGRPCTCGRTAWIGRHLRALAQPYAGGPDFCDEWRMEAAK